MIIEDKMEIVITNKYDEEDQDVVIDKKMIEKAKNDPNWFKQKQIEVLEEKLQSLLGTSPEDNKIEIDYEFEIIDED